MPEQTPVTVTVQLSSGDFLGTNCDWWLLVVDAGSLGVWSYVYPTGWTTGILPLIQLPLMDLPSVPVFSGILPAGNYIFYFGVDSTPDGTLNAPIWYDSSTLKVEAPPLADYGDAPDGGVTGYTAVDLTGDGFSEFAQTGQFPTRHASDGARALDVDQARLGLTATAEIDAASPADSDDCLNDLHIILTSIPPAAELAVQVTAPQTSAGGTYYLNVLIDLNMNGAWGGTALGGEPEWVVQNQPVTITPGMNEIVSTSQFAYASGSMVPENPWMRVALTKEAVVGTDWDGTGEFSAGEIEDHIIQLPDDMGKQLPVLSVQCLPVNPITFGGANSVNVSCSVFNHRIIGGNYNWYFTALSGGVTIADPTMTAPQNGACPPVVPGGANPALCGVHTATFLKGTLPSTWKFLASPDPVSVVTDGGIIAGLGESSADISFNADAAVDVFFGSAEASFTHYSGYSQITGYFGVYSDAGPPPGPVVITVTMSGPNSETKTFTTDASGNATALFTIDSWGTYTLTGTTITGDGVTYNAQKNSTSSVTVVVN